MENEKTDYSEMFQGNVENKPARNKSSTDSLKGLGCDGSSSSDSFFSQRSKLAEKEQMHQELIEQAFTQGTVVKSSGESSYGKHLPYYSPRGHNQANEFASRSHVSTQNQHQNNSYKNQNVSHHPHQSHGGRQNQEHVNQNWNPQGNFNQQGGFLPPPAFVRPSTPLIYAQHIPVQQLFYPIAFTDLPPQMMYHPHRMPFIDPHAVLFPSQKTDHIPSVKPPPVLVPSQKAPLKTKIPNEVQEAPLKIKILNQVQYYLSEDNLPNDVYLCKRMNDEGFVHIEFIAGFNKVKELTSNVQLILDSLRDSDIVEV